MTEGDRRPGLFLGTSSDRIGSPEGATAYYATASKYFAGIGASVYASLNYSEWDEGLNVPFGAAKEIGGRFALRYMYDGQRSHALADYTLDRVGVSLMSVWLEQFGVSLYAGF